MINMLVEWSVMDGMMVSNFDIFDVMVIGVMNSGVMNYFNKFGLIL